VGDSDLTTTTTTAPPCDECDVFKDGFETGDFSLWTGESSAAGCNNSVQGVVVYQGSNAAEVYIDGNNVDDWSYIFLSVGNEAEIYHKFHFRTSALPPDNTDYSIKGAIWAFGEAWVYLAEAQIYNDNGTVKFRLNYYESGVGQQTILSDKVVAVDTWYCIVLRAKIHDTDGAAQLWVDNVLEASDTGIDTKDATTGDYVDRISIGVHPIAGDDEDYEHYDYFDDVCVDDDCRPVCDSDFFSTTTTTAPPTTTVPPTTTTAPPTTTTAPPTTTTAPPTTTTAVPTTTTYNHDNGATHDYYYRTADSHTTADSCSRGSWLLSAA
jgi:hypothetical protein